MRKLSYLTCLLPFAVVANLHSLVLAAEIVDLGHVRDNGGKSRLPPGDIHLEFSSECRGAYVEVLKHLTTDADVETVANEALGREGERSISIITTPGARERVFDRLKAMVPKNLSSCVPLR